MDTCLTLSLRYYTSSKLNEKSDVYGFGVVLLEIITGHPAITMTHERTHVAKWVSSMLTKGDVKNIIEPRLHGEFDINSVWKALEVAMLCVSPISTQRPHMNEVVMELKVCLEIESARKREDSVELMSMGMQSGMNSLAR